MSDYLNRISGDSELDAILAEVKKSKAAEAVDETEEPSKTWSIDDIDKLIAETNGEEYVPAVKKEKLTPAEDFTRILSREFDTAIFTLRPMKEETEEKEDVIDDFDSELFELETVIVPEDIPAPPAPMFAWQETEKKEEKAEVKEDETPSEIKGFFGEPE